MYICDCTCDGDDYLYAYRKAEQVRAIVGADEAVRVVIGAFDHTGFLLFLNGRFKRRFSGCAFNLESVRWLVHTYVSSSGEDILALSVHGQGNSIRVANGVTIPIADISECFADVKLAAVIFDSCCMGTRECAESIQHCTPLMLACRGYMWAEDWAIEQHVINSDSIHMILYDTYHTLRMLLHIASRYVSRAPRADICVWDTRRLEIVSCFD